MDKSQKYVQMCKASKEIQQQWTQGKGDWFVTGNGSIRCCVSADDDAAIIKNGFRITKSNGIIRLSKYIWLPRLDQLMDMAKKGASHRHPTYMFYDWTKKPYAMSAELPREFFTSVEQSWLGFVMETRYFKKWNRTEWMGIILTL